MNKHSYRQFRTTGSSEKGVVIVVALFIVALVAAMSLAMLSRLERDSWRTTLIVRNTEAEFLAQGSIAWAIDALRNNWIKQKANRLVDNMPLHSNVETINAYAIQSTIYDMQAKFNLNNLLNPESQNDFKHLLKAILREVSDAQIQSLVAALVDWITPGITQNEYTRYYLELPFAYRPAHRNIITTSELSLVKGFSPDIVNALKPYITALPEKTKIDVQSAPAQVLVSLSPTMTAETARSIENHRREKPILNTQAFLALDVVVNHAIPEEKIITVSDYFLIETRVSMDKQKVLLYTLVKRNVKENNPTVQIIWQNKHDNY